MRVNLTTARKRLAVIKAEQFLRKTTGREITLPKDWSHLPWNKLCVKIDETVQKETNQKYWLDTSLSYAPNKRIYYCTACTQTHRLKVVEVLTYFYSKGVKYPIWILITQHPSSVCEKVEKVVRGLKP